MEKIKNAGIDERLNHAKIYYSHTMYLIEMAKRTFERNEKESLYASAFIFGKAFEVLVKNRSKHEICLNFRDILSELHGKIEEDHLSDLGSRFIVLDHTISDLRKVRACVEGHDISSQNQKNAYKSLLDAMKSYEEAIIHILRILSFHKNNFDSALGKYASCVIRGSIISDEAVSKIVSRLSEEQCCWILKSSATPRNIFYFIINVPISLKKRKDFFKLVEEGLLEEIKSHPSEFRMTDLGERVADFIFDKNQSNIK